MTIPKTLLQRLAGLVWIVVGTSLAVRGARMLPAAREQSGLAWTVFACVLGLLIGAAKGKYVLSKSARKNVVRIHKLETPRPWNIFSAKFYPLIGLMIGFGALLRWSAGAGYLNWSPVAGLYLGIGAALIASSIAYFQPAPVPLVTRVDALAAPIARPTGLLLVNLGTPDGKDVTSVRRYLKEFLGDRRVVEAPRPIWFFVLRCIILPFRGPKSAEAYGKVWGPEGSPLLVHSEAIAKALGERLGTDWNVQLAMRYGQPSLSAGLEALHRAGVEDAVVLPLFAQASNTTTGTVQAEVARLEALRRDPLALSFVGPMYDDPGYVRALAERVREAAGEQAPDFYVFSFHGLPESYVEKGDPYLCHCTVTAFALAAELGLERDQWEMIFQSRFGSSPWLQPFADEYVPALAAQHKRVLISLPGFAADCLETLEEIGQELAADFVAAGGQELIVVPALNDSPTFVEALAQRVEPLRSARSSVPNLVVADGSTSPGPGCLERIEARASSPQASGPVGAARNETEPSGPAGDVARAGLEPATPGL